MRTSVRTCLLGISLLLAMASATHGQTVEPEHVEGVPEHVEGVPEHVEGRFSTVITLNHGLSGKYKPVAVSGICILTHRENLVQGSMFNEFGITAINFTYDVQRRKVKLHNLLKGLDKWYIRHVLRKDLPKVIECMEQGETSYLNSRRHILYEFTPLNEQDDGTAE